MVITDGSQQDLNQVLQRIQPRDRTVRVFTYLIGREVTDTKTTESIACNNFGYFTHLKDMAEVKEEVQLYVPVLSRPIGLHARDATVVCSSVYADPLVSAARCGCLRRSPARTATLTLNPPIASALLTGAAADRHDLGDAREPAVLRDLLSGARRRGPGRLASDPPAARRRQPTGRRRRPVAAAASRRYRADRRTFSSKNLMLPTHLCASWSRLD